MKKVLLLALLFFLITLPASADQYTDNGRGGDEMFDGSICVKTPERSSSWQKGTPVKITWTFIGNTGNHVKIVLLRDYKPVLTIAAHVYIEKGEYTWPVPDDIEAGDDYTVKVTSETLPMCYGFSDKFKLQAGQ